MITGTYFDDIGSSTIDLARQMGFLIAGAGLALTVEDLVKERRKSTKDKANSAV